MQDNQDAAGADERKIQSPDRWKDLRYYVLTICLASAGGWLFSYLQTPVPWMLGSLTATGIAAMSNVRTAMPRKLHAPTITLMGAILGSAFTPQVLEHVSRMLVSLIGLAIYLAVAGACCYLYFRKVAGFDRVTAYFSGLPGGVVEMVVMGAERGGDDRMIALIHAARIFLVVMVLPFLILTMTGATSVDRTLSFVPLSSFDLTNLTWFAGCSVAGYLAASWIKVPARLMLWPMIFSMIVHLAGWDTFNVPTVLVSAVQVIMGAMIGTRFAGVSHTTLLRVLKLSVGSTSILLGVTAILAFAVSLLAPAIGMEALILAYSPGAIAEMSVLALALGYEIPFVVLHHVARIFMIVSTAGAVFSVFFRDRAAHSSPSE
ncbi:AbrB family transcriptional regulator [Agrobacterium tumefaciens]|uniref:AbrB family transcriptional regulator n=1 Tax=Agrobacterium tumefaciens TaxID=358 RepID=UPI0012B73511|nr:AbrB family transcriptional regulator [Agrobacterium tumefaciens]MQB07268.1 AbrB family transcriptional regulator [Agrobacterium tumefaciens]